jgi:hypothetical protein
MNNAERFRLRFGQYKTPRFKYEDVVFCEMRGEVTIVELSDTRIPWPIGKTKRAKAPILYKSLAAAVRRESNQAVCYWWGVTPQNSDDVEKGSRRRPAIQRGPWSYNDSTLIRRGVDALTRKHGPWRAIRNDGERFRSLARVSLARSISSRR